MHSGMQGSSGNSLVGVTIIKVKILATLAVTPPVLWAYNLLGTSYESTGYVLLIS